MGACGAKTEPKAGPAVITAPNPADIKEVLALGRVEPQAKIVSLSSEVSGLVTKIYVNEGQSLEANSPILEISHSVKDAEIALAQSRLSSRRNQMEADKASIEQAEVEALNRKTLLERLKRLVSAGAETKQAQDDAQTAYDKQQIEIKRLKETLQSDASQLNELQMQIALHQAERNLLTVKAPAKGLLLSLDAKVGANLSAEKSIGDFAPESPLTFLCEVDELFADRISNGATAVLRNQGATAVLATGKVIYAAPYLKKKSLFSDAAGDAEDRRVREVRVLIEPGKNLLINSRLEGVIQLSAPNSAKSDAK